MTHITRYGRRLKRMGLNAMIITGFVCMASIPFVNKKLLKNEVGYYSVIFNGNEIGYANSKEDAEKALANARLKFSKEYDEAVYMEEDIEIVERPKLISKKMEMDELTGNIYTAMFDCVTDRENSTAYTLRIDDFTVTLATKDEVVELLEMVTEAYDTNDEFQVQLAAGEGTVGEYSVDVAKSEVKNTDRDIVAAAIDGATTLTSENGEVNNDGIKEITFEQSISVNEALSENSQVVSVEEAFEAVTKENAKETTYVVEEGDCLSLIATKCDIALDDLYAMNDGLTEDTLIVPGDELIVTVPKSELSVVVKERMTYEEDYNAEIQYVDDNTSYRGTNKVIQEGTTGHHKVTADITYVNGVKTEVAYISEEIMTESQPKIISVGTLTPPTYLKPLSGGNFTSGFGSRWGKLHKGVDWACSVGTPIYSASAGTVTRASWYSGYGYCVDIKHADGKMTRYAHLSSLKVSAGQTVSQSQLIGLSGNTGNSTGPHLHFEMYDNGSPVNPLNYVNKY